MWLPMIWLSSPWLFYPSHKSERKARRDFFGIITPDNTCIAKVLYWIMVRVVLWNAKTIGNKLLTSMFMFPLRHHFLKHTLQLLNDKAWTLCIWGTTRVLHRQEFTGWCQKKEITDMLSCIDAFLFGIGVFWNFNYLYL